MEGGRGGGREMKGRRRGGRGRSGGRAGKSSESQKNNFPVQIASINSPDIVYVSLVSELPLPGWRKRGPVKLLQRDWMK